MPNRPRILASLLTTLLAAALVSPIASCGLDTNGSLPIEDTKACLVNENCDDQNPCTVDVCGNDRTCVLVPVDDGPMPGQVAGDCQRVDCVAGAVVTTNDDADIENDGESCTNDACVMGAPVHTPAQNGASCLFGTAQGTCQGGACSVECSAQKPCEDGNPCTEDACNAGAGTCLFTDLDGLPTPGYVPVPGDCLQHICVAGDDTAVVDDTDIPVDMNSCTLDVCTMGAATNPPVSAGEPCEPGKPEVCDGASGCVECNDPADCGHLPPDDVCQQRTCDNHVCGQTFAANGTPFSSQAAGDCMQVVCDGAGATKEIVDDADLPNDDNACTKNVCTNGAPSFPSEAINTACGAGLYCDGGGTCVGCNEAAQCDGADDFCKVRTCINNQCGVSYTPEGTALPDGQTALDCKVVECDGQGHIVTSPDTADKPVDGNTCTDDVCSAAGVPSNPNRPVNAACDQNGGTVCNGAGVCKKAPAQTCGGALECLSGHCVDGVCCDAACSDTCKACNIAGSVGTCTNVPAAIEDAPTCTNANACDGAGVCKKDSGQTCAGAVDCVSGFCVDGVCCNGACDTACFACNLLGSVGTCAPLVSAEDTNPTNACAGTRSCDAAGACKSKDGGVCLASGDCLSGFCVDGVCCDTDCTDACKACNLVGAAGVCSFVAKGQDDMGTCAGANQSCDGAGVCKKVAGETCAGAAECLSGFCADGVCCNAACDETCTACNVAGSVGTCTNVPISTNDAPGCVGTNSCDGAGACKKDPGEPCQDGGDCVLGFCTDENVCCTSACAGTCQTCNLAGSAGTCTNVPAGQDDAATCAGMNQSCDGAGACKKKNAATCGGDAECMSGHCVDGVCCDTACTGTCLACNLAASPGVCSFVANGQDDPMTCTGMSQSCDGAGACKKENAATCDADAECFSGTCVDGVCCDTACAGTCLACDLAASPGVCSFVASGQNDDGTCDLADETCDGAGACKTLQGKLCGADAECLSDHCVDGVCCDDACTGICEACSAGKKGSGADGVCEPITLGTDPDMECTTPGTCDGAGMCIGDLGDLCGVNADCASGHCVDDVCCNVACADDCFSCALDGMEGQCMPVPAGTTDGTCVAAGPEVCDGAGVCLGDTGFTCTDNAQCFSNHCENDVCAP
ncbi:hypothetical protein [Polyangium sorediatum]|uniref:Tryptophan synthase alpha chain n=1 Tax=Polyangium sorediatum TaxID=889274 RepID=A0ABT6NYU9_9BACT|nr:hypothetical protein [Polyangium sorediatum]MDI1433525.1 hypothetical protein [Polyangium sorediatum]